MTDDRKLEPAIGGRLRSEEPRLHRRTDVGLVCDDLDGATYSLEEDLTESLREWYREQIAMVRIERTLPEAQEYRRLVAARRRAPRRPSPVAPVEAVPENGPVSEPEWLSTRAAARLLRVRNQTLYACADEAIAADVAQETGRGGQRRHVRWNRDLLPGWWAGRSGA